MHLFLPYVQQRPASGAVYVDGLPAWWKWTVVFGNWGNDVSHVRHERNFKREGYETGFEALPLNWFACEGS